MLQILLSEDNFQYDIYSLAKAFFPWEDVQVQVGTGVQIQEAELLQVTYTASGVEIAYTESKGEAVSESVFWNTRERKTQKNQLKALLYSILSHCTGRTLPWGNLTGIRPVKIPMLMLEQGKQRAEVEEELAETYCMSREKINLSLEIAEQEIAQLQTFDYQSGYSLYVGIPFCPTTCLYCSFTSYPIGLWKNRTEEYLQALYKELKYISEIMGDKRLDSVYIGGGTPTTLEPEELEQLIGVIRNYFDCSHVKEFSVEAGRPDSITKEKLMSLKKCGVERISVNPQTMNDDTLKIIGRQHTVDDIRRAFEMAKNVGFDTINMDIILGLPGETLSHLEYTLKEIQRLNPENLTVHSLALKRAARLSIEKAMYEEAINIQPEIMMKEAENMARAMGMAPYYLYRQKNMAGNLENVGYAKEGHAGLYNILIMEEKQTIIAAGAGAMSKYVLPGNNITRVENVKDVTNYINRVDEMIARKKEVFDNHGSNI